MWWQEVCRVPIARLDDSTTITVEIEHLPEARLVLQRASAP
jgi:hypothetical protein